MFIFVHIFIFQNIYHVFYCENVYDVGMGCKWYDV